MISSRTRSIKHAFHLRLLVKVTMLFFTANQIYPKYSSSSSTTIIQMYKLKYFGIEPLEEVIGVRRYKFLKMYCATDSYLCRLINARH